MSEIDKKLIITRDIIVAYVSRNHVPPGELDKLVIDVYKSLIANPRSAYESHICDQVSGSSDRKSMAEIRNSIQSDGIVSFIDGKTYKSLRRHLTAHGLSADAYRERFGLDKDYPMVAPSYAEKRAEIARRTGLGRPGNMIIRPSTSRED